MISLTVNGMAKQIDADPSMPLLWVLRDVLKLTGTKYSCGIAACGACTVHINGKAAYACVTPLHQAAGKSITTIEGIAGGTLHPIQQAWLDEDVSECGFCQPGQIMTALALLQSHPHPTDEQITETMSGVLCRCGSYQRIHAAIKRAAIDISKQTAHEKRI